VASVVASAAKVIGNGTVAYPDCLKDLTPEAVSVLSSQYLRAIDWVDGRESMFVDKSLCNFMHIGFITLLFPDAKIIHCRRNAMDTCLSCYFQDFASIPYASDLRSLGVVYRLYQEVTDHWRTIGAIRMFEVEYERMVDDTEVISREMLDFCGLPWDSGCLAFHRTARPVFTASSCQVKRPIYHSSVGRWRNYERHLGDLEDALVSSNELVVTKGDLAGRSCSEGPFMAEAAEL